jgi:hypothetical protein
MQDTKKQNKGFGWITWVRTDDSGLMHVFAAVLCGPYKKSDTVAYVQRGPDNPDYDVVQDDDGTRHQRWGDNYSYIVDWFDTLEFIAQEHNKIVVCISQQAQSPGAQCQCVPAPENELGLVP